MTTTFATRPAALDAGLVRALLLEPAVDLTRSVLSSLQRRRLALADRLYAFAIACREEES